MDLFKLVIEQVKTQRDLSINDQARALALFKKIDLDSLRDYDVRSVAVVLSKVIIEKLSEVEKLSETKQMTGRDIREYQLQTLADDHTRPIDRQTDRPIDRQTLQQDETSTETYKLEKYDQWKILDFLSVHKSLLLFKKAYILFDSFNKSTVESFDNYKIKWNYSTTKNQTSGYVTTVAPLRDIVSMQLFQPSAPYVNVDTITYRVSILFNEFLGDSYTSSSGAKYHFLTRPFKSTVSQARCELQIADFNDGFYKFASPMNLTNNTFTVSLGKPLAPLYLYNDVLSGICTAYFGTSIQITTSSPHNCTGSFVAYITGFTTNTATYDNNVINNPFGVVVSYVSASVFSVPITTTASWITNQPVTVKLVPHRVLFAVEFTYRG